MERKEEKVKREDELEQLKQAEIVFCRENDLTEEDLAPTVTKFEAEDAEGRIITSSSTV